MTSGRRGAGIDGIHGGASALAMAGPGRRALDRLFGSRLTTLQFHATSERLTPTSRRSHARIARSDHLQAARSSGGVGVVTVSQTVQVNERTEIRDGMTVDFHVPIPMNDGIVLRADVYRPIGDGQYPA
ncbi:MAG: hypothetical protein IT307_07655, partial [Chloroflexi bacterium]|nr:hypothetical protein [Chloroflexota bacterium]